MIQESTIRKYRKILNVTEKELGRGLIAKDTIKLLEKGKRKLTIPTASILVNNFNNIGEEKGILLNLNIKDLILPEKEFWYKNCIEELNIIDKKEFNIENYLEILKTVEKFNLSKIMDRISYTIGDSLYKQKKYEEALVYLKKSLEIKNNMGYTAELPKLLNRIGAAYIVLRNYNNAFNYIRQSYDEIKKQLIKNKELEEKILFNLSLSLVGQNKYEQALEYINKLINLTEYEQSLFIEAMIIKANILSNLNNSQCAIQLYKKILPKTENKSLIYYNLSVIYSKIGDDRRSLEYAHELIKIESINIDEYTGKALIRLGNLYKKQNLYKEAVLMYEKGIFLGKKFSKLNEIIECYEKIFQCYEEEKRLKYFEEYLEMLFIDLDLFLEDLNLMNKILILLVQYSNKFNNLKIIDEILYKIRSNKNEKDN